MAEEEIENEAKFIRVGEELERERHHLRFPAFFILSGADNTEVTAYRMCLYSSLSLRERAEREGYLREFIDMVEVRYASNEKELRHLEEYRLIDHLGPPDEDRHRQVLAFYVRETFYYGLLNAMLRLSRSCEEFRPCALPFSETYQAIRYFHAHPHPRSPFTAYRGAKLRNSDVKALQVGSLIELLGFTSTSLSRQQAQKFMDNDSYLIQIVVDSTAATDEERDYDHGFVEVNGLGLAVGFEAEEEVLFNALNVYRVTHLDLESAVRRITLQYGAVVDLVRAKRTTRG